MDHNMCIPSFSLFLHSQICPAACKVLRSIFRCHRRGREIMIQAMRRPYPSRCAHIKSQMPTNQDHRHQQTAEDFVQSFGSANMFRQVDTNKRHHTVAQAKLDLVLSNSASAKPRLFYAILMYSIPLLLRFCFHLHS